MRRMIFILFIFSERAAQGGGGGGGGGSGGGGCRTFFFFFFFPVQQTDYERDWPPCKVVFFGLATNALNVRNSGYSEGLDEF